MPSIHEYLSFSAMASSIYYPDNVAARSMEYY